MNNPPLFCFVLRPFALGVNGLSVLVGRLRNGDHEAFALCSRHDGQSDAVRLEFTQVVDVETVIQAAQQEARRLLPHPEWPVVWIQTADAAARSTELSCVSGAMEIALRSVKSPGLRDVFVRVRPEKTVR